MKKKYKDWTLIDWDGNLSMKLKCWRKSFRNGHVSVGIEDFELIVFSYGPNSDYSMSSTRWNYDKDILTPEQSMEFIDKCKGYSSMDAFRMGYISKKEQEKRIVMNIREEFKAYRDEHKETVKRDTVTFMKWYDKAGEMVLNGESKEKVIEKLSPWGCDLTQSNGVQAGALQASRLIKFSKTT